VVKTLRRCLLWRKAVVYYVIKAERRNRDDSFWNRTTNRRKPEEILKNIQTQKRRFQI
jgi:hypothetical protein